MAENPTRNTSTFEWGLCGFQATTIRPGGQVAESIGGLKTCSVELFDEVRCANWRCNEWMEMGGKIGIDLWTDCLIYLYSTWNRISIVVNSQVRRLKDKTMFKSQLFNELTRSTRPHHAHPSALRLLHARRLLLVRQPDCAANSLPFLPAFGAFPAGFVVVDV